MEVAEATAVAHRLEHQVLVATEGHWMRDSIVLQFLETHLPRFEGSECTLSCGPAALAAFLGHHRVSQIDRFRNEEGRSWTNRRDMEKALLTLGFKFERQRNRWPKFGLCLIQWEGPWLKNPFRGSELSHTHWVSVAHGYIFDVNWGGWLPQGTWEEIVAHRLLEGKPGASGWHPSTSYDLQIGEPHLDWLMQPI